MAPAAGMQRTGRVEAEARLADHQRMVAETRIGLRVADDLRFVVEDRVRGQRALARNLAQRQSLHGLQPFAITVDQADRRDRQSEQAHGQAGDALETLLAWRIEQVQRAQRVQALGFVWRQRGGQHEQSPAGGTGGMAPKPAVLHAGHGVQSADRYFRPPGLVQWLLLWRPRTSRLFSA